MGRTKLLLLVLCALVLAACGRRDREVAAIDGEYFADDYEKRIPFRLTGDKANELAGLVTDLEPTEHLTWQGAAVFTITYANGTKREVSVFKADAVIIDGKVYKADVNAILAIIKASAEGGTR